MNNILNLFDSFYIDDIPEKVLIESVNIAPIDIMNQIDRDNIEEVIDDDESEYYYLQKFMIFFLVRIKKLDYCELINYLVYQTAYYTSSNHFVKDKILKFSFEKLNVKLVFIPLKNKYLFFLRPLNFMTITNYEDIRCFQNTILDYFKNKFIYSSHFFYEQFTFRPPYFIFIDHNKGQILYKKDFDFFDGEYSKNQESEVDIETELIDCKLCEDLFLKYITI